MQDSIWIITPPSQQAEVLSAELSLPLAISNVLLNRRISDPETASKFLFASLDDLHDPYHMRDMKKAVKRIKEAISKREKILIFGDYDVDGILSIVILTKALETLGADVSYFIPDRLENGYGIKEKYIAIAEERQAKLVMSVDCGIKANAFVSRASQEGIDVVITDHHQPGSELPPALAILNPALPDSSYPDKKLAGVGVVFKLIQALFNGSQRPIQLSPYLKMVSIATIADVAELRGENRLLVKFGLKSLAETSNVGLSSLLEICRLKGKKISVGDVGFRLGPRINAAGRMGEADLAVELFFLESFQRAGELAHYLDNLNSKRQRIEENIYNQALNRVKKHQLDKRYKFLVMGCEEWHRGIIGIVASKLKDKFHRPVLLFAYKDSQAYGSGRSIKEFPLINCLDKYKDLFVSYGGHTLAVGCELERENVLAFKEAVNSYAESRLTSEDLKRKIYIDAELSFSEINSSFLDKYWLLAPFGIGNPRPVFLTRGAEIVAQPQKIQGKHSKLWLKQDSRIFEALGWGREDWAETLHRGEKIDLVYSLQLSRYLGEDKLSLSVEDIKF